MDYCGPRGIELDAFLRWSPSSQEAALTWQGWESRRCSGCGTHPDDWNPELGGDRTNAYHAEHFVCPGCARSEQLAASSQVKTAGPGGHIRMVRGPIHQCPSCALIH